MQGEIVDIQVDRIENGQSIHRSSRAVQDQVVDADPAYGVNKLLDPRHIIDVIDVMHCRLDRRRVAAQAGDLKHLTAAPRTAAVGVTRVSA